MTKTTFLLILTLVFSGATRAEVNIVTTIKPLQLIAQAVIQDHGRVTAIMDPQQSPHHFSMSPSDRIALAQTDIAIWVGPEFETFLTDFFSQKHIAEKTLTLIEIPDLLLHSISTNKLDAHLWLDSSNAVKIAGMIADQATKLDPGNETTYRQNLNRFAADIDKINLQLRQRLSIRPRGKYAVYHNAYQYFEKQFGLQHALTILQDPEKQPGIRQLVQIRQQVQEQQPACLLLEMDASEDLVNTVLNEHQLRSISVDLLAYRITSGQDGYMQFMANLGDDFVRCLYE